MAVLGFKAGLFLPPDRLKGILRLAVAEDSLDRNLLFRVACSYSLSEPVLVPPSALLHCLKTRRGII